MLLNICICARTVFRFQNKFHFWWSRIWFIVLTFYCFTKKQLREEKKSRNTKTKAKELKW